MIDINTKALELYPDNYDNGNFTKREIFIMRKAYIKGREDERLELSGTPEEAEEVLKPYLWEGFDGSAVMNVEQIIEVMLKFRAAGVAWYATQIKKVHSAYMKIKNDEIQSLQQQLSEKEKRIETLKQRLELYWQKEDDNFNDLLKLRAENTRLKAEVERLTKDLDDAVRNNWNKLH